MSSWLGSGISQLTGQLSTFTKEVLTEGTEEVDDHETQLKLARTRVLELEAFCGVQKNEVERVVNNNKDLEEKLESSELQINAISTQYRTIIQQKETEIKKLQHHQHALLEGSQHSPDEVLANPEFNNQLHLQIPGNATQALHAGYAGQSSGEEAAQLQEQIQTLQAQLCSEQDTHQVELAALQDVHSQKISLLKKRHKEEIRKYKQELEDLQHTVRHDNGTSVDISGQKRELEEKVRHLEEVSHKQSVDLQHMHAADKQNTLELDALKTQLKQTQDELTKLETEHKTLTNTYQGLLDDMDAVTKDNQTLKLHMAQVTEKLQQNKQPFVVASTPKKGKGVSEWRNDDLGDGADDSIVSDFNQMSQHSDRLDNKVLTLQQQVDTYEREIEHFEMVKSDWLMEKEALEEVLLSLREQMRGKEEALSIAQAQQGNNPTAVATESKPQQSHDGCNAAEPPQGLLALEQHEKQYGHLQDNQQEVDNQMTQSHDRYDDDDHMMSSHDQYEEEEEVDEDDGNYDDDRDKEQGIEEDVIDLNHKVDLLTRGSARLENEHDIMTIEKNNLLQDLQGQKDKVAILAKKLETVSSEHQKLVDSSNAEVDQLNTTLSSTESRLIEKEQEVDSLRQEMSTVKSEIQQKDAEKSASEPSTNATVDNNVVKEQLAQTKTQLAEVWSERDSLMEGLEELDTQHQQAIDQVIKSRDQVQKKCDEFQHENDRLHETAAHIKSDLSAQLEQKNNQLNDVNVKLTQVTSALQEKTSELSDAKVKLTEFTLAVNELHMNKKELEDTITNMKQELMNSGEMLKETEVEKNELIAMCSELKSELRSKQEEVVTLQSSVTEPGSVESQPQEEQKFSQKSEKELEDQLQSLQNQLDFVFKEKQQLVAEIETQKQNYIVLATEKEQLFLNFENVVKEKEGLSREAKILSEEKQGLQSQLNQLKEQVLDTEEMCKSAEEKLEESNAEWKDRFATDHSAMVAVRDSVERELKCTESEMKDKIRQYEKYIHELTESRELDTSSLQAKYENAMKVNNEKDNQITKLESEMQALQSDMEYNKDMLQTTIDGQSHITDLLSDKDSEIGSLKSENDSLIERADDQGDTLKQNAAELDRLNHIEVLYKQNTEENKKLKVDIDGLKKQIRDMKTEEDSRQIESNTLGIITDLEAEITNLKEKLEQREEGLEKLKSEILELHKTIENMELTLDTHKKENKIILEKLQSKETDIGNLKETNNRVNLEMQKLSFESNQKGDTIKNQENLIETLKQTLLTKETTLKESGSRIELLNNELLSVQKSSNITNLKHSSTDNCDSVNKSTIDNSALLNSSPSENIPLTNGIVNGGSNNVTNNQLTDFSIQVDNLKTRIEERDGIIGILKDKNNMLTKLLEERSMSLHGDTALVDIHKLETELRSLRVEKEQMMQVLNDKTRECSQLKGEVHNLMNVVSAEKTALSKLQQDNQQMKEHESDKPNQDMSKEAVKSLSRMIRDKDLEIESLSQKNQTLLQVLHDSSPKDGGTQISTLIQERDNLSKQLVMFQNDREQIVAALGAKHQESVAYHAEVQRLNELMSTEGHKQDVLQQEYSSLRKQYTDKQQILVSAQQEYASLMAQYQSAKTNLTATQDELNSYKQRYAEIDNRYKDILQKKLAQGLEQSQKQRSNNSQAVQTSTNTQENLAGDGDDIINGFETLAVKETDSGFTTPPPLQSCDNQEVQTAGTSIPQVACDHQNILEEMQNLQSIISMHEEAFEEKDKALADKFREIQGKDMAIVGKDNQLHEKDKQYNELSTRFHKTEQMLRTRDTEIGAIKKQNETLVFQLKGIETEVVDLRTEKQNLSTRSGTLEQQLEMNKEANNKLSIALKDHAFELNALKEKNNTLTRLLQEKGTDGPGEKGEMDRLMKETETLQHQARVFKVDADQFAMALQQQQEENRELKTEMQKVNEREQKLSREVERLRNHLMQVEEGYTRELLEAEEREKDLRNRLAAAEDRALSASSSVDRANLYASKQIEGVHEQLQELASQRDTAVLQHAHIHEQAQQYAQQLTNLQMVLEQFQQEKEQQQAAEIEHYLREVSTLKQQYQQLSTAKHEIQLELDECKEALEAAQRLSEQLDRKEEMISALRIEVQDREHQLTEAEDKIAVLSAATDAKIDKALAKNLILGYFHTPASHKKEVILVLANALDFAEDEIQQLLGDAGDSSWFGGLFKKKNTSPTPPTTPRKAVKNVSFMGSIDKSFSELFVTFLERESSPTPEFRFPAEKMAREQQEKFQEQHNKKPAFNPFSAPVPSMDPFSGGQGVSSAISFNTSNFPSASNAGSMLGLEQERHNRDRDRERLRTVVGGPAVPINPFNTTSSSSQSNLPYTSSTTTASSSSSAAVLGVTSALSISTTQNSRLHTAESSSTSVGGQQRSHLLMAADSAPPPNSAVLKSLLQQ